MQRAADSLEARSQQMFVRPFQIASYYDEAGQTDLAFEWLEKAYEAREPQHGVYGRDSAF